MALFYIGIGMLVMWLLFAFSRDQGTPSTEFVKPSLTPIDAAKLPIAVVLVRADRDLPADISHALDRGRSRWN